MAEDAPRERAQVKQTSLSAEAGNDDVLPTTFHTSVDDKDEEHDITTAFERAKDIQHEKKIRGTFTLKTHDGVGYALPFLPWETIKVHLKQIYELKGRERLAEAVENNDFSMLTESGDIILPVLWEAVVRPSSEVMIVQVSIPPDILDPDNESIQFEKIIPRSRRRTYIPRRVHVIRKTTGSVGGDSENTLSSDEDDDDWVTQDSGTGRSSSDSQVSMSDSELSVTVSSNDFEVTPSRTTLDAVDDEGNKLSFRVDTTFARAPDRAPVPTENDSKKTGPQGLTGEEHMRITKAVATQTENRNTLQVYVLPGPRGVPEHSDVSIRWYHLHSQRLLDFARFKETCLSITGPSARLYKLTKKLLEKVEKERLKAFLGGMFIEPGTVLRVDESDRSDPTSAIFSCIPYFNLQTPTRETAMSVQLNRLFPVRTLLQSYYPYEPVRDRDAEQAYRKFGNERPDALIHVPNFWMLNISSNIVVTCGYQPLSEEFVQSIEVVDAKHQRTSVKQAEKYPDINVKEDASIPSLSQPISPPSVPFLHWPQKADEGKDEKPGVTLADLESSTQRLEHVEKAMLSEVLNSYDTQNAVDKTFTSTTYYRNLKETTAKEVESSVKSLFETHGKRAVPTAVDPTIHQIAISHQHATIAQKTSELYHIMHSTVALFVDVNEMDKSTLLRRSWGAMLDICSTAKRFCNHAAIEPDPKEYADPGWTHPSMSHRGWLIRLDFDQSKSPAIIKTMRTELKKCRKCRSFEMYSSPQKALLHLQKHTQRVDSSVSSALTPEHWVVNYAQFKMELSTEGLEAVLTKACKIARDLLLQAKELADGVLEGSGELSTLYTFSRAFLSALRQILVFYFAIERSLHFTEETYQDGVNVMEDVGYLTSTPFSPDGLCVLEAFGNGVQRTLAAARNELCVMAKSTENVEIFKRLSLSSEYVCSWLMRRLIVKPLEKSMTVSDMYREYLSTVVSRVIPSKSLVVYIHLWQQFQVNHRPGKRLLRSINLLQEELIALQEINTQQSKLISNYTRVLNDATYEKDIPSRRAMFPYERMLLESCQDSLQLSDQEYRYLIARCGPLSDSTKQSLEINEEDHGKAIMVFTIVTVIFLPLSFVTSFLGMNTTDIRDMGSSSWLFWAIALPLTAVTMGSILYIGYNGDELRDTLSSVYRAVTGKQNRSTTARGISVAQRQRARKLPSSSDSNVDFQSLADEAEYANPRPGDCNRATHRIEYDESYEVQHRAPRRQYTLEPPTMRWEPV
ncbi:hypothetical protein N0V94_009351 [Neodidymelliopsis sp. IMI 364377]|nr:hypothetical protein N0V94_009351 [Neodidymelliopsis sp. IMI 364377]